MSAEHPIYSTRLFYSNNFQLCVKSGKFSFYSSLSSMHVIQWSVQLLLSASCSWKLFLVSFVVVSLHMDTLLPNQNLKGSLWNPRIAAARASSHFISVSLAGVYFGFSFCAEVHGWLPKAESLGDGQVFLLVSISLGITVLRCLLSITWICLYSMLGYPVFWLCYIGLRFQAVLPLHGLKQESTKIITDFS